MRALDDADFLSLWERGWQRHPLDRALLALSAAFPELPREELADWPLGRRNQALIQLRCQCFGSHLRGSLACPNCGEKLEFELNGKDLSGEEFDAAKIPDTNVVVKGCAFRLPTSRDLASAAGEVDPETGATLIVKSCQLEPSSSDGWSREDFAAIEESLALADPLAETRLTFNCPECENESQESFDITAFFWTEIEARVRRVLHSIHILASAYGWSESQILSLSEGRRSLYLQMAQS